MQSPVLSRVTNVRLQWHCREISVDAVRCGIVTSADRKATHSDKLNFMSRGNAPDDVPLEAAQLEDL